MLEYIIREPNPCCTLFFSRSCSGLSEGLRVGIVLEAAIVDTVWMLCVIIDICAASMPDVWFLMCIECCAGSTSWMADLDLVSEAIAELEVEANPGNAAAECGVLEPCSFLLLPTLWPDSLGVSPPGRAWLILALSVVGKTVTSWTSVALFWVWDWDKIPISLFWSCGTVTIHQGTSFSIIPFANSHTGWTIYL